MKFKIINYLSASSFVIAVVTSIVNLGNMIFYRNPQINNISLIVLIATVTIYLVSKLYISHKKRYIIGYVEEDTQYFISLDENNKPIITTDIIEVSAFKTRKQAIEKGEEFGKKMNKNIQLFTVIIDDTDN
jgi:hypothetical protein